MSTGIGDLTSEQDARQGDEQVQHIPVWNDSQRDVLAAAQRGDDVIVTGPAGSGKSALSIEIAAQAVAERNFAPEDVVIVTSSRRSAARLRDQFMARLGRTTHGATVRSTASLSYSIIAAQCRLQGIADPVLTTGPQQDADLAQLLYGHLAGEGVAVDWPAELSADTLKLQGFREQLRDLLMRCAERGLSPHDLAELGRRHGRQEWVAAAQLYDEYLSVSVLSGSTADRGPRFDAATIVDQAAWIAQQWLTDDQPERSRWKLVVVDEYQDATAAAARLFGVLQRDGAQLVLLSDPDQAVQGFRGSRPDLAGVAELQPSAHDDEVGRFGAHAHVLKQSYRFSGKIQLAAATISHHIGAAAGVRHRLASGDDDPTTAQTGIVERHHARSRAEELDWIGWRIRSAHFLEGVPWSQCVVVARSGAAVSQIVRALQRAGVPANAQGSDLPLRSEPAVRILLDVITRTRNDTWDDAAIYEVLTSPYGDLDTIALRQLKRTWALVSRGRKADDALVTLCTNTDARQEFDQSALTSPTIASAVHRIADMITAARRQHDSDDDPSQVLWRVWQAAKCAQRWREQAMHVGMRSLSAHANLDAVMTLFKQVETFSQRYLAAPIELFIQEIERLNIPADSLAATSNITDLVQVLTPTQAAGQQWKLVVVAGVQQGTWPNLRLRDTLLGAQQLADIVDGRDGANDPAAARKAILDDELRLFLVACSRAQHKLAVTCVDSDEEQPSPFLDLVTDPPSQVSSAPVPLDLRGLITQARSLGAATPNRVWAQLLAQLAHKDVAAAHPSTWYGIMPPSTDRRIYDETQPVAVSPSKLNVIHSCAIRWLAEHAQATNTEEFTGALGTLIHDIARHNPQAGPVELREILQARFGELGLGDSWPAIQRAHEAEDMVTRLGLFQQATDQPIAVEAPFEVDLGNITIHGSIDRIDATDDGLLVRDIKTGRTVLTSADAAVDPQLAAYQLALETSSVDAVKQTEIGEVAVAGAELLYIGANSSKMAVRRQDPLHSAANPQWITLMARQAAQMMSSSRLWAKPYQGCRTCPVKQSCPVWPEGQPLVAPRGASAVVPTAPLSTFGTTQDRHEIAYKLDAKDEHA